MSQSQKVISETIVEDETEMFAHRLYDSSGNLIMRLIDGVRQTLFTYNELNQITRKDSVILDGSDNTRYYLYTYNAAGLVASEEEFQGDRSMGKTTYTYDAHGNRTSINSGIRIPVKNTYDEQGRLIKADIVNPMNSSIIIESTVYTYEGDHVIKIERYSYGELSTITILAYDETGLLTKEVVEDAEGGITSTTTFAYADIDASFAPYNVQASAGDDNTIVVTWEGSANSAVVDGKFYDITGSSFTTPVLVDGTYTIYVANNGNATATESLNVIDNTKVGASDVCLDGDITATITIESDPDGTEREVTTYNIPIKWDITSIKQPIGYRIYYNSTYYVDVEDGTLRNYVIPAKNIKVFSFSEMQEIVLDFVIRVIAIYDTGQEEPENLLYLDTESILNLTPTMLLLGDVNGDGNVTPADAIMILYHYFNIEQPNFKAAAADLNNDGDITPSDAIEVLYKFFDTSQRSDLPILRVSSYDLKNNASQKHQPTSEPQ